MSIAIYLLLVYSFSAMLFDLTTGRIPNYLVAAELVGGLVYQLYIFGPMGILSFLGGITVPFALSYALFLFRMIGAGDIKLFMALGSVAGYPRNLRIMLWSVICGALCGGEPVLNRVLCIWLHMSETISGPALENHIGKKAGVLRTFILRSRYLQRSS